MICYEKIISGIGREKDAAGACEVVDLKFALLGEILEVKRCNLMELLIGVI